MRAAPRPEPIREPEEVFLVDRIQHRSRRPLDDLVLKGRDRKRTLPAVRLGYVDAPRRQCPIRSPVNTSMQVLKIALKVPLVIPPRHAVHTGCNIRLEFAERLPEQFDVDMVEERGEPFLLPLPCCLPYALHPV